jgi:hypothetical protein
MTRALRPTPSNEDFTENLPQAMSVIKATNPGFRPAVINGQLNLIPAAQRTVNALQQTGLEPWLQRMEGTTVDTSPIVAATAKAIRGMLPSEQQGAQGLIDRAQQDYANLSPRELRDRLRLLNDRLSPMYNASQQRQSTILADIPDAVLKAQRDAVAETLYRHLDPENMGAGPRQIQQLTGDVIDIRDSALRRQNAITAEQPLTPAGAVADFAKSKIKAALPFVGHTSGISFAEGSEGRTMPLLRRSFNAVDKTAGANAFGGLPQPAGQPPVNVQPTGPGAIGPTGTVPRVSRETPRSMPPTTPITMDDIASYAQKNQMPFTDAAMELRRMGFKISSGLPSPLMQ